MRSKLNKFEHVGGVGGGRVLYKDHHGKLTHTTEKITFAPLLADSNNKY